jgi:hypothetical protein
MQFINCLSSFIKLVLPSILNVKLRPYPIVNELFKPTTVLKYQGGVALNLNSPLLAIKRIALIYFPFCILTHDFHKIITKV